MPTTAPVDDLNPKDCPKCGYIEFSVVNQRRTLNANQRTLLIRCENCGHRMRVTQSVKRKERRR